MPSLVSETPAALPELIAQHHASRLAFETDCWDVHEAMKTGQDFVLLDVRGPKAYERGHIQGAVNLPHSMISRETTARWPTDTLFVVYCAGPHCNGANRAALRLGYIGRPAKVMLGGVLGWLSENFSLTSAL